MGYALVSEVGCKFGGSLQMDLSYATIPTCDSIFVRINREQEKRYHVEDPKDPMNELVYEMEDLGNYAILTNSLTPTKEEFTEERVDEVWDTMDSFDGLFLEEVPSEMNFDEAHSKSGIGSDVSAVSAPTF